MHSGDFELARQQLLEAVKRKHASSEVKLYCIHAYMFLGFKKQDLAQIFQKDRHTIGKWIEKFYTKGVVSRKQNESSAASKFDDDHKRWIKEFVDNKPTSYLREIAEAFQKQFGMTIAQSTVFLHFDQCLEIYQTGCGTTCNGNQNGRCYQIFQRTQYDPTYS